MKVKHITQYLFESYKDAQAKFSQEAPEDEVKQYLDTFKELGKKGVASGEEKDIGYWIRQGWNAFKQFVDSKSQEKTKSQVKKSKKNESIIVHEDDEKMVVIPLTKEASCFYGKNTKWCTAASKAENRFNKYFYIKFKTLFYVFMKESGKKYAVAYDRSISDNDFFDEEDKSMNQVEFYNKTGIDENDINNWYVENKEEIEKARDLNNLSEDLQYELISNHGALLIKYIDNPSERIQTKVVEQSSWNIQWISNPSEEIQLKAVEKNPTSIIHIDNPSEAVQMKAVEGSEEAIRYIENPTQRVKELQRDLWNELWGPDIEG